MTRQHKAQHKKEKAQHKTGIGTRQDRRSANKKEEESRIKVSGTYPPQF
jgi:hypothetical protein